MQLLDDDMDELFRNAASQYPLKTDGADWDAVMRRLPQSGDKQSPAFNRLRENKWLKWLLGSVLTLVVLVISVPALRVGVLPAVNNDTVKNSAVVNADDNNTVVADSTANAATVAVNANSNNNTVSTETINNATTVAANTNSNNSAAVKAEKANNTAGADKNKSTVSAERTINAAPAIANTNRNIATISTGRNNNTVSTGRNNNSAVVKAEKNNGIVSADKNKSAVSAERTINTATTIANTNRDIAKVNTNSNNTIVNADRNINTTLSADRNNYATASADKNNSTTVSADKNTATTDKAIASRNNKATAQPYNNTIVPVPAAVNNKNEFLVTDLLNLHLLTAAREKDPQVSATLQSSGSNIKLRQDTTVPKTKVKVQAGLYAGIIASPDISTVKGQRVSNVGYNAGLVFGYRLSRRLAVETGVLYEHKNYYSEASYFSTKKINIPSTMKLINVDGWCKMFEIPLNVRYVFSIKEKSSWYANVGVSSYIMSKESYDYKYEMYNSVTTKRWSFNNATRNWFSIIHVGVGYEHRLGAVGTLRVEPYLKMPAGGVGIGSLPLTSVGLNVGITRPLRF